MSSWNPFSVQNTPGVTTLKRDHEIVMGGWRLVKGPGEYHEAISNEDKSKFPPETYLTLDRHIEGKVLKAGTPYTNVTIGGTPHKWFIIDGNQYLIQEHMSGGKRKKSRTVRRRNKARRQSKKFR